MGILAKGDLVDVVAPSYGDFNISKKHIESFFYELGLRVRISDNLQKKSADFFSAHDLETRASNFIEAMLSEDSKAVWCLRGGYGAAKMLHILDRVDFSKKTKPIIGYSDITALHIYFSSKYKSKTIHGRTISECLSKEVHKSELNNMTKILFDNGYSLKLERLDELEIAGKIQSEIVGGNLTLIESSLGTNWQINAKDKILIIEEAFEQRYRVDRSLEHLYQAGVFDGVTAVIFGNISYEEDRKYQKGSADKKDFVLQNLVKKLRVPVYHTNEIGHGETNNPIIFGSVCNIENSFLNQQVL